MGCSSSAPLALQPSSRKQNAFFENFSLSTCIGRGSFGQVFKTSCKQGSWAVKILDVRDPLAITDDEIYHVERCTRAEKEVNIWEQVGDHQNVVRLAGATFELGLCMMVMECCDSSLEAYLRAGAGHSYLNELGVSDVLQQTLVGCEHIHSQRVIHRDIKAENLLVRAGVVKLIDFGLAFALEKGKKVQGVNGTPAYMAPEMINKQAYDFCVDIWAVGVMAYTLFFGDYPYNGEKRHKDEMKAAIAAGDKLPSFRPSTNASWKEQHLPEVSPEALSFAKALLARNPAQRPTASSALHFDFLTRCCNVSNDLPDMLPIFECALKAGTFGRSAKRREEITELDEYLDYLKKHPKALALCKDAVTIVPWQLTESKVKVEDASQVRVRSAQPAKQEECATPTTVGSPWNESRSDDTQEI